MKKINNKLCLLLTLSIAIIMCGCSGGDAESASKEEATPVKEEVKVILDAGKFAFISAEKLAEIMGEPDSTEDWTYNNSIPVTTYAYDKGIRYEFLVVQDKVSKIHIYSERYNNLDASDISYDSIESIPLMFGITDARKYKDTKSAVRYDFMGTEYYDMWIPIMDQTAKTFEEVHIIFATELFK